MTTGNAAGYDILLESKQQLVAYMEAGCKPKSAWRIGTEHEKFGFRLRDTRPLPYEGEAGIRAVLEGLTRFGWEPKYEGENPIALTYAGQAITLEPGGQFELSGAPLRTVNETCRELNEHLGQVREVSRDLGVGFMGLGFQPKWPRSDIPWMPKSRYGIMRNYMPKRGALGHEMMQRTCTAQVNLDFDSEADMVKKFRVSLALQPIATALFANSPFTEGKPNGFLSLRSHIWTDTDPDRCGMLPWVFDASMGFERYIDYILDVPMYFVYRNGTNIDAAGQSFRDFMDRKLPALPGEQATLGDFVDHLTTVFPEVRLKHYLEMRGADSNADPAMLCAVSALWVGLLYDGTALDAAWDIVKRWNVDDQQGLRDEVPRAALRAKCAGQTVQSIAMRVLDIAHGGLKARHREAGGAAPDESGFLEPLQQIATSGLCPAERLLEQYRGQWGGSIEPIFSHCAY